MHNIKSTAITREGFEYQDCLGIEFLIEMYIDRSLYEWVKLDADDHEFKHVDDIVAKRKEDGKFICRQVKFRVDPEREDLFLSFKWLTAVVGKTSRSTSLLEKWSQQVLLMIKQDKLHDAKLLTNAKPDEEVQKTIDENGYIDFDKIPDAHQRTIILQLGDENQARKFFKFFQFDHSKTAKIKDLKNKLRDKLVPNYTDENGWLNLRQKVKDWAIYINEPQPDGCIKYVHISQLINKKRSRPITQDFLIPTDYQPPDPNFHKKIIDKIEHDKGIIVISGSPGRGKSTYISYLCEQLSKSKYPLIRHHYFLSLEDGGDRYTFNKAASSLLHQMEQLMPEVAKDFKAEELRECIIACAKESSDKPFILVIDGLDHVWRENSDIDQMQTLFNHLLQLPDNVTLIIGTQDVPEEQLPQRLMKHSPKDTWEKLPLMSVVSIRHWLNVQTQEGAIDGIPEDQTHCDRYMNELSKAFYDISGGHPLHLVYSFENLVAQTKEITVNTINSLPKCPEGDIRKYYEGLWVKLSSPAKEFLHLFAATDFYWPENGLYECLGYDSTQLEAFNSIKHLVDRRKSGIVPFHGSILVFIRSKKDHSEASKRLLPMAVEWLENKAEDYWRWAWLWVTQAKIGIEEHLLSQPSREWAINALCKGYPIEQMASILEEAARIALKHKEYCRLQELLQLKIRLINCAEFQTHHFDVFQHCVSLSTDDSMPFEWMADNLSLVDDQDLITISRKFKIEKPEVPYNCLNEMYRRADIRSKFKSDNYIATQSDAEILAAVAAYVDNIKPTSIINYTKQFRDDRFQIYKEYINHLFSQNKLKRLLELWEYKMPLNIARELIKPTILLACREQVALEKRNNFYFLHHFSLSRCWLKIVKNITPKKISYNTIPSHKNIHDTSDVTKITMYEHFFLSLDIALNAVGPYSFLPIPLTKKTEEWIVEARTVLEKVAKKTAEFIIDGRINFDLKYLFELVEDLVPPDEEDAHDNHMMERSFRGALIEISIDLYFLFEVACDTQKIEFEHIEACNKYRWWNEFIWYERCLELPVRIMSDDASKTFFDYKKSLIQNSLSEFIERTNEYTKLSKFTLLYGLNEEYKEIINLTADCMLGYGEHKDPGIFNVLDAIEVCQENNSDKVEGYLKKIEPIIKHITDITDGDETRHAKGEYHNILARADLNALIELRSKYLEDEEWWHADQALESIIKFSDLNSSHILPIIETAISDMALEALEFRAKKGDKKAQELYQKQMEMIGRNIQDIKSEKNINEKDGKNKNKTDLDYSKYPLENIENFIQHIKVQDWQEKNELVKKWMEYWIKKGEGQGILSILNKAYEDPDTSTYIFEDYFDIVFELSKSIEGKNEAYKWLVRAHIEKNGWNRYFSGRKKVKERWKKVADEYPEKWQEYIEDTAESKYSNFYEKHEILLGTSELVQFLFMVGQNKLAENMTETLINIIIQEMADQPL